MGWEFNVVTCSLCPLRGGRQGLEARPSQGAAGDQRQGDPDHWAGPCPAHSQLRAAGRCLLTRRVMGMPAAAFGKLIKEDRGLPSPLQSEKGEVKKSSSQQRVRR